MLKIVINWIVCLFKKVGIKVCYNGVDGYFFEPPVFSNKKAIIMCHGGWGSFPKMPKLNETGFARYVYAGYSVLFLRYDDEFTTAPTDMDIEKDTKDVYNSLLYLKSLNKFEIFILLGVSRGGFVVLHSAASYPEFDLCIAMCAPSNFEAIKNYPPVAFLLKDEGVRNYFYQWPQPIERADKLAKKPLLLAHGEEDDLIPAEQSISLFLKIYYLGGKVKLKLFEDVGHGFSDNRPVVRYIQKQMDDL